VFSTLLPLLVPCAPSCGCCACTGMFCRQSGTPSPHCPPRAHFRTGGRTASSASRGKMSVSCRAQCRGEHMHGGMHLCVARNFEVLGFNPNNRVVAIFVKTCAKTTQNPILKLLSWRVFSRFPLKKFRSSSRDFTRQSLTTKSTYFSSSQNFEELLLVHLRHREHLLLEVFQPLCRDRR
jgi:hypothetical protein